MRDPLTQRPSTPTALWRLLHGGLHIWRGWRLIRFHFHRLDDQARAERVSAWAREMLRIWRIQLQARGTPCTQATLLMANHISWLDILVLLATSRCHFVGKSELAHWPVLGTMVSGAGTVFVERASKRDVLRVVTEINQAVQQGKLVAVFPEGTTTNGVAVLPFHANMFEAAIASGVPVQPVSLSYRKRRGGETSEAPAYVGDDSLFVTVWRTLRARPFAAHVHFLVPQRDEGRSRRMWATDVRAAIVADLSGAASHATDALSVQSQKVA